MRFYIIITHFTPVENLPEACTRNLKKNSKNVLNKYDRVKFPLRNKIRLNPRPFKLLIQPPPRSPR